MRRPKLGDVYSVKVPNGYKLIQWAYHIEKYGRFVRVFDGLYEKVPENISDIAAGPHSYIIELDIGMACKLGLMEWCGNYSVPSEYPTPEYQIHFCRDQHNRIYAIKISKTPVVSGLPRFFVFPASSINELPEPYNNVKMLLSRVSLDWLLYLFDNDFSLSNPDVFEPKIHWGDSWAENYQVYIDMVNNSINEKTK